MTQDTGSAAPPSRPGDTVPSTGHTDPQFAVVRTAFDRVLAEHPGGMSLAVYQHGQEVVHLAGGVNQTTGTPFGTDSLVLTASCTKGVTAICAHLLAQRGLLDFDAPVAHYWPEFAANGKAGIPVRWLLTHQAGLPLFPPEAGVRGADLLDWDRIVSILAAGRPMWEPGSHCGYHAITYGYLVGEVIRRISGLSVGRFLATEITGPLAAEFWIGLPEEHEHRVLPNTAPPAAGSGPDLPTLYQNNGINPQAPLAAAMLANGQRPTDTHWHDRAFHAAEIPAANGIGTARGLARLYAACVGELDGVRLLSEPTVERARTPRTDNVPTPPELRVITSNPPRFGLGFQLPRPTMDAMLGPGSFGHTGAGGRLSFALPEHGVAFGFTCDTMLWDGLTGPDPRWTPLLAALQKALAG